MPYLFLVVAIALEVLGTSLLSMTNGFTRLWPSLGCLAAYASSFMALAQTVKEIPIGLTYAMWSGLGTAAIVAVGIVAFHESMTPTKLIGVALVIGGVVTLNAGGAR